MLNDCVGCAVAATLEFDPKVFLATAGIGRKFVKVKGGSPIFTQGDDADSLFYLQKGRVKITVVSAAGKEVTVTLIAAGEFIGEEAIIAIPGLRLATATALTSCLVMRIQRKEMLRALHEESKLSDMFTALLLRRSMRTQADLVDHLFNSSEKRLARILLLMAEFGKPDDQEMLIPHITQETLAEMIGTTRSRVSYFMNRFRKLGFIDYAGRITVRKSLLNVVLHDNTL